MNSGQSQTDNGFPSRCNCVPPRHRSDNHQQVILALKNWSRRLPIDRHKGRDFSFRARRSAFTPLIRRLVAHFRLLSLARAGRAFGSCVLSSSSRSRARCVDLGLGAHSHASGASPVPIAVI
jgi:hypothetical protein